MKKYTYTTRTILVTAFIFTICAACFGQFGAERRPFDFSDKFYTENGVDPERIVNRRSGEDKDSVFDTISDDRFRDVRIRSVFPAYDQNGAIFYWNLYGELYKQGFLPDRSGREASITADFFPIYVFPSAKVAGSLRQAHLIQMSNSYFEKNPLGLGVQVIVEFTDRIKTREGAQELAALSARNGLSLDGTPIIKTAFEIEDLTRKDLIRQRMKGLSDPSQPPIAIAKIIQDPQMGAIAPDAFLLNDLGLKSEAIFSRNFECLQLSGTFCESK